MPDYWGALAASDAVVRALMEGPSAAAPLDLDGRLERLVEARLRVAVLHACTYEVEGGPSQGTSTSSDPHPAVNLLRSIIMPIFRALDYTRYSWGVVVDL